MASMPSFKVNDRVLDGLTSDVDDWLKFQFRVINEKKVWTPLSIHFITVCCWITTGILFYFSSFVLVDEKAKSAWILWIADSVFFCSSVFLTIKFYKLVEVWNKKMEKVKEFEFKFGIRDSSEIPNYLILSECRRVMSDVAFQILIRERWIEDSEKQLEELEKRGADNEKLLEEKEMLLEEIWTFRKELMQLRLKLGSLLNISNECIGEEVHEGKSHLYFIQKAEQRLKKRKE